MKSKSYEARAEKRNQKRVYTMFNGISSVFLIMTSFFIKGATMFIIPSVEPLMTRALYPFLTWVIIYGLWGIWIIWFGLCSSKADEAYHKVSRFLPISLMCSGVSLLVG